MFLNLIRGDWLRRPLEWVELLVMAIIGIVFGFGLVRLRPFAATGVALVGVGVIIGAAHLLFSKWLTWFPWLILVIQVVVAHAWSVLFNSVQFYVQKRIMENTLSMYLSPKLVKKFARDPRLLKPGAEKQTLTIVFTDIEDFTSLSQGMDSDKLAEFMNRYFHIIVGDCIHPADGTVVKYIGDAVFAFWNAPEAQDDHALRACDAALRMRKMGEMKMRGKTVRTRVGIHTGEANVGNFGSLERVDYTALGENVNLASRLEGLNKFVGTDCLISGETRSAIGDRLVMRRLGLFTLKGFDKSVEVFEIVGLPETAESTRKWREAFAEALGAYEGGHFELAAMAFRGVLDLKPGDGPTEFYLGRLDDLSKEPLEGDWTGVTLLREK
jgi:adenylate cyclase